MPTILTGGLVIRYAHFVEGISGVRGLEQYLR